VRRWHKDCGKRVKQCPQTTLNAGQQSGLSIAAADFLILLDAGPEIGCLELINW
jgi:hypothetical protein